MTNYNFVDAVPTVAGSHMTLFRPTIPRIPGDRSALPGEVRTEFVHVQWLRPFLT
jgi:hypothetical protein